MFEQLCGKTVSPILQSGEQGNTLGCSARLFHWLHSNILFQENTYIDFFSFLFLEVKPSPKAKNWFLLVLPPARHLFWIKEAKHLEFYLDPDCSLKLLVKKFIPSHWSFEARVCRGGTESHPTLHHRQPLTHWLKWASDASLLGAIFCLRIVLSWWMLSGSSWQV